MKQFNGFTAPQNSILQLSNNVSLDNLHCLHGVLQLIDRKLPASSLCCAQILYQMYHKIFKCDPKNNNIWYQYSNDQWITIHQGEQLRQKISQELICSYIIVLNYYGKLIANPKNDLSDKFSYSIKVKFITDTISNLLEKSFQEKIMQECQRLFDDPYFQPHLIQENPDKIYDKISDKISDKNYDEKSDKILNKISDKNSNEKSDKISDKISDRNADSFFRKLYGISNKKLHDISNKK